MDEKGLIGELNDLRFDMEDAPDMAAALCYAMRAIEERRELLAALKQGHDPGDFGHGLRGGPQMCAICALIAKCEAL